MSVLANIIRAEMAASRVISFARFMELALYCPVYGFYEQERDTIGRRGDYYTSVSVGSLFGELLAFQFAEWLGELGTRNPERGMGLPAGAHREVRRHVVREESPPVVALVQEQADRVAFGKTQFEPHAVFENQEAARGWLAENKAGSGFGGVRLPDVAGEEFVIGGGDAGCGLRTAREAGLVRESLEPRSLFARQRLVAL